MTTPLPLKVRLEKLRDHVQYMMNMLALGQTLMNLDHATLTDLFNECQPAQKNSLDHAENLIREKDKQITDLREDMKILLDALSRNAGNDSVAVSVAKKNASETLAATDPKGVRP